MRWLVDAIYLCAAVALAPLVVYRAYATGKYRCDWDQRRGHLPDLPAGRTRVWIHAVSVGEVNAVRGLVQSWQARSPETEIILSTTTDTGVARARQLFPDLLVIRYPLDLSWCVSRALDRVKPSLVVLVELEVWYQFATLAAGRGIPVCVVNGRLSERSCRRFAWVGPVVRQMFGSLAWVGAQDEVYAARFRRMGVPSDRVAVTSSMKWDTADLADTIAGSEVAAAALGLDRGRPIWVCGSTGPGEEEVVLAALERLWAAHPGLQVILVPRKPERFDEVADLIVKKGFTCVRRSESPDGTTRSAGEGAVFLGDTMGELRKFYSIADVVFVGRTLAKMGGSDMMEVAALARPVVVGPHTENFADTMRQFQAGGGVRVLRSDLEVGEPALELAGVIDALFADPEAAKALGAAGREVVKRNRGAIDRTLNALMERMPHAKQHTA
ncbi:MAG: 3-deoxy-D-manno-octulosonic acid transferase [Phycisphaerae bacterium]|nr:3-deoxy-D-manno-octulosonic acid transferase [Phycisphaerae bacterium]